MSVNFSDKLIEQCDNGAAFVTVYLPAETMEKYERIAQDTGRSIPDLCDAACEEAALKASR